MKIPLRSISTIFSIILIVIILTIFLFSSVSARRILDVDTIHIGPGDIVSVAGIDTCERMQIKVLGRLGVVVSCEPKATSTPSPFSPMSDDDK